MTTSSQTHKARRASVEGKHVARFKAQMSHLALPARPAAAAVPSAAPDRVPQLFRIHVAHIASARSGSPYDLASPRAVFTSAVQAAPAAVVVFRRGPLDIALSLPQRPSQQTPIYFIVRGRGVFLHDGKRELFVSGDLLFVAAGIEHQIEDISKDFAMWRVFYGPSGGEISE